MQFTPPEIWKCHAVLLGIPAGNTNINISMCLVINLRTAQTIQKQLDEFNGDYKGMAADKKRTHKFLDEIQVMIDNDPSNSINP